MYGQRSRYAQATEMLVGDAVVHDQVHIAAQRGRKSGISVCAHAVRTARTHAPRTHDTHDTTRHTAKPLVKAPCNLPVGGEKVVQPPREGVAAGQAALQRHVEQDALVLGLRLLRGRLDLLLRPHDSDRAAQATHRKCTYRERHVVFEGEGGGRRVLRVDLDVRWEVDLAVARRQDAAGRALGIVLVVAASSQHTHTRATRHTTHGTRHTTHDTRHTAHDTRHMTHDTGVGWLYGPPDGELFELGSLRVHKIGERDLGEGAVVKVGVGQRGTAERDGLRLLQVPAAPGPGNPQMIADVRLWLVERHRAHARV